MSDILLTVGLSLVLASLVWTLFHLRVNAPRKRQNKRLPDAVAPLSTPPLVSDLAQKEEYLPLNPDAFSELFTQEAASTKVAPQALAQHLTEQESDDDDFDIIGLMSYANGPNAKRAPKLELASLAEIHRAEALKQAQNDQIRKTRILGDDARELGIRYFERLLQSNAVTKGSVLPTNNSNLIIAQNALRNSLQSATLSHGGVAQRVGESAICFFEPLENNVMNVDRAIEAVAELIENKTVVFVLANTEHADHEALDHIAQICCHYDIPKSHIFIEQSFGDFVNYIEDTKDFVPERIDVDKMPEAFFSELFEYAHDAYDRGDNDCVVRVLLPLLEPLFERVSTRQDFSKLLLAQALNLMGMCNRDLECDDEAVACFDASLFLLRQVEDYEAIKSVKANLGITLALSRPLTLAKNELAIRHLGEVTQLNPRDDEAWLYLANTFLEQFRMTQAQSLLKRAMRAYEKVQALKPSRDVELCMHALRTQIYGPQDRESDDRRQQHEALANGAKEQLYARDDS